MSPLYFIAAISGSYLFLLFMKQFKKRNVISFIGENSLIYLCCHQYFLFVAAWGLHFQNPFLVTLTSIICCGIVALFVNRYCPFIIGKRKN
jgi:fucose 4-O-acetylase-like acetyltransferase